MSEKDKKRLDRINRFRKVVQDTYNGCPTPRPNYKGGFDEILCYELHSNPINPRMGSKPPRANQHTGLCFNELAKKWGISISFLGELIADHCERLEKPIPPRTEDITDDVQILRIALTDAVWDTHYNYQFANSKTRKNLKATRFSFALCSSVREQIHS